jgi:mRNA interferase RelE/StbE
LAWIVSFADSVEKQLKKLAISDNQRIMDFMLGRVANLENPRSIGESLKDKRFAGLWRYRVGDFRIICDIRDKEISILVISVGHRSKVYK